MQECAGRGGTRIVYIAISRCGHRERWKGRSRPGKYCSCAREQHRDQSENAKDLLRMLALILPHWDMSMRLPLYFPLR